jgi:hypothetical protein
MSQPSEAANALLDEGRLEGSFSFPVVCTHSTSSGVAARGRAVRALLLGLSLVASLVLCAGELVPTMALRALALDHDWTDREVVLICLLCILTVLLAGCHFKCGSGKGSFPRSNFPRSKRLTRVVAPTLHTLLLLINTVPLAAAIGAAVYDVHTHCAAEGKDDDEYAHCDALVIPLDQIGFITARLARLDLGACLLLIAGRTDAAWLLGASGGVIAYPEGIPLHRTAGWWCAVHSALHSVAYFAFYLRLGGLRRLWTDCFPVDLPDKLNRLGLVNFFGVLAFLVLVVLALLALPHIRRRWYDVFVRWHLLLGMGFVVCSALHDLPVLWFAVPGLAGWALDRIHPSRPRRLRATAQLLDGTSSPWVELKIDCGTAHVCNSAVAHGQWASVSVLPLGKEAHPLSIAVHATGRVRSIYALVSSRSGDWSAALAALAQEGRSVSGEDRSRCSFEVDVAGPFPAGGGEWSLCAQLRGEDSQDEVPALMLVAGGSGIVGWLPGLAAAASTGRRCRLVWCVKAAQDYFAMARWLPRKGGAVDVTVFVTQDCEAVARMMDELESNEGGVSSQCRISAETSGQSTLRFSNLLVSLVVALLGIAVCYLADMHRLHAPEPTTLASYALKSRCLPIVMVMAAMVVVAAVGPRAVSCKQRGVREEADARHGKMLLANEHVPPQTAAQTGGLHDVRAGRPDVEALVMEAVALARGRLVVAACGPAVLVSAAQEAAALAAKMHNSSTGVEVEFSGSDPRW